MVRIRHLFHYNIDPVGMTQKAQVKTDRVGALKTARRLARKSEGVRYFPQRGSMTIIKAGTPYVRVLQQKNRRYSGTIRAVRHSSRWMRDR